MKNVKGFIFCFGAVLFLTSLSSSQQRIRTVNEELYRKNNEPLKVRYEVGNQAFSKNNQTSADRDWIKNLSLNVTNISGKPITYFFIQLVIEKQDSMEYGAVVSSSFPFISEPILDALGKPTGEYKKQILQPGESIKVKPPEQQLGILDKIRDKDGVNDISSISLDIRYVHFEDGTRWALGEDFNQDPNNPGHWIRTKSSPEPNETDCKSKNPKLATRV